MRIPIAYDTPSADPGRTLEGQIADLLVAEPEAKEADPGGAAASRLADAVEPRQIGERVTEQGGQIYWL
jgi:hypothetical protein